MPMRSLAPQRALAHTTNSGRMGGRKVLIIPQHYPCVRLCQAHSTLSWGVTHKANEVCNMTTDVILGLAALWLLLTIAYIVRRRRRAGRRAP